jgi:phage terminase large subunit-like protein
MTVLMVPPITDEWPTLGPQVCDFIESYLVFGPGDLRGQPARLDDEKRALVYRMYEVFPQGHPQAGRRRFKRAALSLRKGSAKSEFAAWIAACELHPHGPVRCDGWDAYGRPVGIGVTDPYVPLVAYTEEQSDELVYGALRVILSYSSLADDFDIGMERILRKGGDGKAVSLATAPDARDGARTTFQVFDETHRFTLPRLRMAHRTMMANIPKRKLSDAWSLETTTAPAPGEGSVAEDTMDYARQVADGKIADSRLFFFHRQASDVHDLTTPEGVRAAVMEASGPVAVWSDIEGIVEQWQDPTADRSYLERVWLNRLVRASDRAFDAVRWKELALPDYVPPDGDMITIGFDGARYHDATGLVATHVESGYQWVLGVWEHPHGVVEWEVPVDEVESAVEEAFMRWDVWRMYADPPYWETYVAKWAGQYGDKRVLEWWTNRVRPMAYAVKSYANAIISGELTHDGNPHFARHVGNACRRMLTLRDENGMALWTIYKERPDSPHKIDLAMAGALSWEGRNDALASGVGGPSVYEEREMLLL